MAALVTSLRVLDDSSIARELDLASELFHRINRVLPTDQALLTIPPTTLVREAIRVMRKHKYSQIPVVDKGEVLGVFSFRSFAREAARLTLEDWTRQKCAPGDLRVDEFLENFEFARVTEEMSGVFSAIERDDGVLVGTPERLLGILTPMDFLRYLHRVASPFVLVSEIELALRALIRSVMTPEGLLTASRRCLASAYNSEDKTPQTLEQMTFADYKTLIEHRDTWPQFEPVFGGTRSRTGAKLKEIGALRNDLFHFRRDLTTEDRRTLEGHRNWLLNKIRQTEGRLRTEARS